VDDEIGALRSEYYGARRKVSWASPLSTGSRAGERFYEEASDRVSLLRRALELAQGGMAVSAARAQAAKEADEATKAARREKRARAVAAMVERGMTADQAHRAYGAGQWSNEVDWPTIWASINALGLPYALACLQRGSQASSHRELDEVGNGGEIFASGSFPRRTEWCRQALAVFYPGVATPPSAPPVFGNGWRLITAR